MANMYLQNNQVTDIINVLANLSLHILNVGNNRFSVWKPDPLKSIIQREGNSWSSGPTPPPPPGTPPVNSEYRNRKLSDNNSSDGGSKKSGIGGGGVAEIFISILVVGAVVAFFIVKRRSKKSSADIEKADSQLFTSYASQEVQGAFPFAEEYYLEMAEACLSSQVEEDGPVGEEEKPGKRINRVGEFSQLTQECSVKSEEN
ncbi:hypothetical protein AgCh_035675 [Apium graveolens]